MIVVAFDQSTYSQGYCVLDMSNGGCTMTSGCIKVSEGDSVTRLRKMVHSIYEVLETHHPDMVVFEDVDNYTRNYQIMKTLSNLAGCIIGWCISSGVQYRIYKATTWRSLLGFKQGGIKRDALKLQAIEYVNSKFQIKADVDRAEAICIACAYLKGDLKNDSK